VQNVQLITKVKISAFNRSCERKQSRHIYPSKALRKVYPSKGLKKVAIGSDHNPILFSAANPADEVFGRHRAGPTVPTPPRPRSLDVWDRPKYFDSSPTGECRVEANRP
jgi:hypothetical protein